MWEMGNGEQSSTGRIWADSSAAKVGEAIWAADYIIFT